MAGTEREEGRIILRRKVGARSSVVPVRRSPARKGLGIRTLLVQVTFSREEKIALRDESRRIF